MLIMFVIVLLENQKLQESVLVNSKQNALIEVLECEICG